MGDNVDQQSNSLIRRLAQRKKLFLMGVGALALIAVACGSDDNGGASTSTPAAVDTPTATATTATDASPTAANEPTLSPTAAAVQEIDFSSPSGIRGADEEFNYSALVWQGYWLSRDQFGPLAMGSGLGIPFMPPAEAMMAAIQMVAANADDHPFVPENLAPLQAVYKSGDTALINDFATIPASDFSRFRLDSATFDETVGVEGQAQLMLKESQWARNFHQDSHFGTPESEFGAQQRFMGMIVSLLSQMQGKYAMENLLNETDGLYYDSDGQVSYEANWVMLHALADIAGITGDDSLRYFNPDMNQMFAGATGMLFQTLAHREPETETEYAAAIRALVYVAWVSEDEGQRDAALTRVDELAAALALRLPDEIVGQAAAIAGLVSAAQANGVAAPSINALWDELSADFDANSGVFAGKSNYTTDDVAWIIGGLNSLAIGGPEELRAPAAATLVAFFEATLDQSGMQLSAPPGKSGAMAGAFEMDLPSVVYYHGRNTPPPPMAGGDFGRIPLPAAEVAFDGSAWSVVDATFDTAGGMHLANELNWLGPHLGSILFPDLNAEDDAADSGGGEPAQTVLTISAQDTLFDTGSLTIPAGTEVQITLVNNDDTIPHNLHISGPGGFDVQTEIFAGSDGRSRDLVFTADEPGAYTFTCDVHPAQMNGTVTVQ